VKTYDKRNMFPTVMYSANMHFDPPVIKCGKYKL